MWAKMEAVTGNWRKLHDGKLHDLYGSPNDISMIKSKRTRWAGHLARRVEKGISYVVLAAKPEEKRRLERPRHRWENIKMNLRDVRLEGLNWVQLAQTAGRSEDCNELWPSINYVSLFTLTRTLLRGFSRLCNVKFAGC